MSGFQKIREIRFTLRFRKPITIAAIETPEDNVKPPTGAQRTHIVAAIHRMREFCGGLRSTRQGAG
jgi:hypothetical protein